MNEQRGKGLRKQIPAAGGILETSRRRCSENQDVKNAEWGSERGWRRRFVVVGRRGWGKLARGLGGSRKGMRLFSGSMKHEFSYLY